MTTSTTASGKSNVKKTDMDELRRSQRAMRAALNGEILEPAAEVKKTPAKKAMPALNATTRETAVFRATSLLSTMTEYYGITVGELDDEKARLATLTDEQLMATVAAYEMTSRHVSVMLRDDKAREAAIARSPQTASFYGAHGVGEDDLLDADRQAKSGRGRKPH
jgi:hypothetical protein